MPTTRPSRPSTDEYAADCSGLATRELADLADPGNLHRLRGNVTFVIPLMVAQYSWMSLPRDPVRHIARLLVPAIPLAAAAVAQRRTRWSRGFDAAVLWIGWMIAAGWSTMALHDMAPNLVYRRAPCIDDRNYPRLSRRVTMLQSTATDMEYPIAHGRAFGSEPSDSRRRARVRFLPWPEWIYQQISELTIANTERSNERNRQANYAETSANYRRTTAMVLLCRAAAF